MNANTIRETIKNRIDQSGVYVSTTAKLAGMSPELLRRSLAGSRKFTATEFVSLCQLLGLELKDFEEKFSDEAHDGKVDFAMFGCPHFTLEEAKYIAEHIEGKKLAIPMYILVSSHALQMAERMGIARILNEAGAEIISDSCPDQPCWHYLKGKVGITESPKCAYYPRRRGINFMIRDLDTCIEAALTGEVK